MSAIRIGVMIVAVFAAGGMLAGCGGYSVSGEEIMKKDYRPANMCDDCARRWDRHEKASELKMCVCDECNKLGYGCEKCRRKIMKMTNECETCGKRER